MKQHIKNTSGNHKKSKNMKNLENSKEHRKHIEKALTNIGKTLKNIDKY